MIRHRRTNKAPRALGSHDARLLRPRFEPLENRLMLAADLLPLDPGPAELGPEGEPDAPLQPIILLPGILGSMPRDDVAAWLEFDAAAMQPENLQVDPIKLTYDDLAASLVGAGYNDGSVEGMQTLWAAPYDWRLPVAPRDGLADGHIDTTSVDPTDLMWEYGVEYLHYWIEQARSEWMDWGMDPALFSVDIVAHSMGGLVARSYLQSDFYDGGEIDQLLMLGTPNHGAVDAYLAREWIDDVLGLAPDLAVESVATALSDYGYDGALASTILVAGAQVLNSPDAESYSPSITDLLPTFDFISKVWPHKWLQGLDDNTLLVDLNDSYDYSNQGVDAKLLYGTGIETNYEVYHPLGMPLLNLWTYDELPDGDGDGRVLAASAQLSGVAAEAMDGVEHIKLAGADIAAQQEIFQFLGLSEPAAGYHTGEFRTILQGIADWASAELNVLFAGLDAEEFVRQHLSDGHFGDGLIAHGDHYAAFENQQLVVRAGEGILANDVSDTADAVLTIHVDRVPLHGELVVHEDGGFTYQPDADYNREDSFRYWVSSGDLSSEPVTVDITVATEFPWHNGQRPTDVNADTYVAPSDVLDVIRALNRLGGHRLPVERIRPLDGPFYDVNRDGYLSPGDALAVIRYLNAGGAGDAEGESSDVVVEPANVAVSWTSSDAEVHVDIDTDSHVQVEVGDDVLVNVELPLTGFPQLESSFEAHLDEFHDRFDRLHTELEEVLDDIAASLDRLWQKFE